MSVDLIQKLEQGRKSSARITSLIAIAQALDVDLSDLLGKRVVLETIPEHGDVARQMPKDSALPVASRARHLTDVAHAHARLGHYESAKELLLRIERTAPRWIGYQPFTRAIVAELKASRYKSAKLEALAHRLGVGQ